MLTLDEYRALVMPLGVPSTQNIEAFADYVAEAHSWYKHLPFFPPGQPFHFFLDPAAGMQRTVALNGSVHIAIRKQKGFHYSWIPTDEYRARFGYLAYSELSGQSPSLVQESGQHLVASDDYAEVFDPRTRRWLELPVEAKEAGTAMISGAVHPFVNEGVLYHAFEYPRTKIRWPSESGGRQVLKAIRERVNLLNQDPSLAVRLDRDDPRVMQNRWLSNYDFTLSQLIEPERLRQRQSIVDATNRLCGLIWTDG